MRSKSTELMSQIREYIERYFDRHSSKQALHNIVLWSSTAVFSGTVFLYNLEDLICKSEIQ